MKKAFHYYSLAAAQDHPEALTSVGYLYSEGLGTEQNLDEMLKYYNLAAELGEPMAQFNLGCCYRDGIGVEQDYEKMLEYFRLAVDQGNANAQFNLGFTYYLGEGVDQDYDEAFRLFQLAADQEFTVAMFAVGDCYYLGNGVEKDLGKAAEWYRKSLDAGYEPDEEDQKHLEDVLGKQLNSVGAAIDETAATEAPAAEMTAEELYQSGKTAEDAEDYANALSITSRLRISGIPKRSRKSAICIFSALEWKRIMIKLSNTISRPRISEISTRSSIWATVI